MKVMIYFKAFLYLFFCFALLNLYSISTARREDERVIIPPAFISDVPVVTSATPSHATAISTPEPMLPRPISNIAPATQVVVPASTVIVPSATIITKTEEEKKLDEEKIKKEKEDKEKEDKENLEKQKEAKEKEEKEKAEKEKTEKDKKADEEKVKKEKEDKEKAQKEKIEKEKKKKEVTLSPQEKKEQKLISTLDTMGVEDEGNWLLKRVWWEQAEATFEKIIEVNDQIIQVQSDYFNKNKDIDRQLTSNFRKLGYEQGELNEVLTTLIDETKKERQLDGDLTLQEREFLDLLNEKKNEIEKLKKDLGTLESQDALIEDALTELVNQINKSREYEKKAWSDFKEIGRVLNDKKAKALFYQIDADLKNVQNILNYIKGDLNNFFDNIINRAKNLSSSIVTQVESLSKEGLNLKEKFEELKRIDEQREEELKKRKEELEKELRPKSKVKKGWLETIGGWISAPVDWISSFFK